MPKVAIQILTYNSADEIEDCVRGIRSQTFKDFKVIFIDNASDDNSVEKVKNLGYEILVLEENLGYAGGHNQGLKLSDSEYVLTLNPDVLLQPEFLAKVVKSIETNPKAGSASGFLQLMDQSHRPTGTIDSIGLIMSRNRRQKLKLHGEPLSEAPQSIVEIFGPDGAAAFYRRAMLEDITILGDALDNDFFMHKEDVDVCWRAQLRGWTSIFVPEAVAYHVRTFRPGLDRRQNAPSDLQPYAVRNRYFLLIKNEILSHFLLDSIFILFYDILIWGYILLFERQSLWAFKSFFEHRKRLLQKRRLIQENRQVDRKTISQWFQG